MVWLDGCVYPAEEARISPLDHGFLVGDGVFETLRVYGGRPFATRRHLERLERSAAGIRLVPPPRDMLERAIAEVLAANADLTEARLRITVTSGPGPLGSARGAGGPTVLLSLAPMGTLPEQYAVVMSPWARNEHGILAGLKTVSYAENAIALAYAKERSADETIFGNTAGQLCEGTGTNVFIGVGGRLITPPLSSGCLAGVTRDLVIELCDVAEEDVPVGALAEADEAFVTGTGAEVKAIATVDGRSLATCPGPLTLAAAGAYAALVARDMDP